MASGSSIPTLKRNASSNVTTHSTSATATAAAAPVAEGSSKPVAANRKRSALGEVTNAGKTKSKAGEEKPAAITRRGTRTAAAAAAVVKDDASAAAVKRRPIAGTSRSRSAHGAAAALLDRKPNVKNEEQDEEDVKPQARKKRKTSSPPIIELEDDEEDLADPAVYDEDGQEVLLSSGGRAGTHLKSPKRLRAKDHGWTDLDAEDEGDPAMVSEYVVDAFSYMMHLEVSYSLLCVGANHQKELS